MLLTWLPGLYAPVKDLVKGVVGLSTPGMVLAIEANAQGPRTWITVTAEVQPGSRPFFVRGCWAELYETAFEACSGPQPVRTRLINFRPGGPVTIRPGEPPVQWEAQVLNEHVRRAVRELDEAATIAAYGEKGGHEALVERDESERRGEAWWRRHPLLRVLAQVAGEKRGSMMRAVLESVNGQILVTRKVRIPPPPPFSERLDLFDAYLAERRSAHQSLR